MTTDTETNRSRFFVASLLPWLVAGGMLLVYLLTFNHSPSINNIYRISELGGWFAQRRVIAPLTFLATYPLRWLPVASIGTGLNLFTILCAVLTLALLARSVALLPHDRTYDQRQRELSESSVLSIPTAWLPPLFAAIVCGFEMTFWENAVNAAGETLDLKWFYTDSAGEMLNLLLFAYCIRCLLEYRITLRISWIARFAFVYGLGMANDWLMIGLFPGFLAALIWIRGLSFFNARFLGFVALFGLAGLSLIFLFPIQIYLMHAPGFGFREVLSYIIRADKSVLSIFPSDLLLLLSLTSILPIFVIAIRWASYFGESSQIGIFLTTFVFHVVHAVFLLACIWVAFDPPFSPRVKGIGLPLLPLYYLGALSIGYFTGYFLLIFGTRPPKARHRLHPLLQCINFAVIGFVWILAAGVPVFQIWINLPQIRDAEAADNVFSKLTSLTLGALPPQGAVVLADDHLRLSFLQVLSSETEKKKDLFIESGLLRANPYYIRSLEKLYPDFKLSGLLTNWSPHPTEFEMIHFLDTLSRQHEVYYIEPSFGYYFERYYADPLGPIYQLKPYDTNTWTRPEFTASQVEENQTFWNKLEANELATITNLMNRPLHGVSSPLLQYFMDTGHLSLETNKTANLLGSAYARAVDYWGVELEKLNKLPEAEKCFEEALVLNPDSIAANVNLKFNKDLQAGKKPVIEPPAAVRDQFGKYRGWDDLLASDGPFDDPSFCYVLGVTFAAGENVRPGAPARRGADYLQAVQQFERVHALAPDFPDAGYWLCKLFISFGKESEAESIERELLQRDPNDLIALYYKAMRLMELRSFDKALEPLNRILTAQPSNYPAMLSRAIDYLELHNYAAAKPDYQALEKVAPKMYQIDYGLQEIFYQEKDTNSAIKYLQLYLTNYYGMFPTNIPNFTPPEPDEVKTIKQRLKELKNGAP